MPPPFPARPRTARAAAWRSSSPAGPAPAPNRRGLPAPQAWLLFFPGQRHRGGRPAWNGYTHLVKYKTGDVLAARDRLRGGFDQRP